MKKNIFAIAVAGLLMLSGFVFTPVINADSRGNMLYVGGSGSGNYSSIQDAIDNASDGDTIFVYSGIYNENVFIDKQIDLIGEEKENTIINTSRVIVNISADNVSISGFTVKGSTSSETLQYFDYSNKYYYITIPNAYGDDYFNMRFTPDSKCKLTTCNFTFYPNGSIVNTDEGVNISVWDDDGSGLPVNELACVNVHPNDINWGENTTVDFTSYNLIFDSDFHIGYTTVNQIEDVYALRGDDGLHGTERSSYWNGSSWRYVKGNYTADVNFLITANISYDSTGIYLSNSDNCSIINNSLKENKIGVYIDALSDNNTIYHNNFINNVQNAYDNGNNTWDNGTEGNYWDDFDEPSEGAYDNNSDGIVDTPYYIPGGNNKDRYPLMQPYGEKVEPIQIYIEDEQPEDGAQDVPIDQSNVSAYIEVEDITTFTMPITFDWKIGGDNITTTSAENDTKGRKEASITGLNYFTTYTWYVNVSAKGYYRNETFSFTTGKAPPVAMFNWSATGLKVLFNASESYDPDGNIVNYSWDFDDDNTTWNNEPLISHTYGDNGNYSVTLTVTDNDGKTDSQTRWVNVTNLAPVANFTYTAKGKTVEFTSTSSDPDGIIVNYSWAFGDGNISYNENPTHTYAEEYTEYTVTLTVTDNLSANDTKSKKIRTGDNKPPSVNIIRPIRGIYLNNKIILQRLILPAFIIGDITVEVNASDTGSGIEIVEFYIGLLGTKLIGNDTEPPYMLNWTRNKDRIRFIHLHILTVKAKDKAGNVAVDKMIVRKFL